MSTLDLLHNAYCVCKNLSTNYKCDDRIIGLLYYLCARGAEISKEKNLTFESCFKEAILCFCCALICCIADIIGGLGGLCFCSCMEIICVFSFLKFKMKNYHFSYASSEWELDPKENI
jgi:hypothetical protein